MDHPRVPLSQIDWIQKVLQDDINSLREELAVIKRGTRPHTFTFRLTKFRSTPDGVSTSTWILATATSDFDEAGNLTSILGTMTDISQLKWAEEIQRIRVDEALESKRQQENFIDMTNHEVKAPHSMVSTYLLTFCT